MKDLRLREDEAALASLAAELLGRVWLFLGSAMELTCMKLLAKKHK